MRDFIRFIQLACMTYKHSFYCKLARYHLEKSKRYIFDNSKMRLFKRHVIKVNYYHAICTIEQAKIDVLQKHFKKKYEGLI